MDPGESSLGHEAWQQAPLPAESTHTLASPDTPVCKCLVSEYREMVFLSIPANKDEWCACNLSGITPGAQSCHQCNRQTPGSPSRMPPRNPPKMFPLVFFHLALSFKVKIRGTMIVQQGGREGEKRQREREYVVHIC